MEYIPFLLLPSKGGLSISRFAETLGSLWFSTMRTFNPLFSSNSTGCPISIEGGGPDTGITDLSTCPNEVDMYKKSKTLIYIFLIF